MQPVCLAGFLPKGPLRSNKGVRYFILRQRLKSFRARWGWLIGDSLVDISSMVGIMQPPISTGGRNLQSCELFPEAFSVRAQGPFRPCRARFLSFWAKPHLNHGPLPGCLVLPICGSFSFARHLRSLADRWRASFSVFYGTSCSLSTFFTNQLETNKCSKVALR